MLLPSEKDKKCSIGFRLLLCCELSQAPALSALPDFYKIQGKKMFIIVWYVYYVGQQWVTPKLVKFL